MAIRLHPSLRVHAGEWLHEEIVKPYGLNVSETAKRLGVTRVAMSALLNGRAGLSANMALRFEKAFGISADTLLRMQARYELAQARANEKDIRVRRVPEPA